MAPLETYWLIVLTVAGTVILLFVVVLAMALFMDMIGTIMERRIDKHRKKSTYAEPPRYGKYGREP